MNHTPGTESVELYIHIPFCARKCNYCDFLSFPVEEKYHAAYFAKLSEEILFTAAQLSGSSPRDAYANAGAREKPMVSSIFIGGGTPSLVDPELIVQTLDTVRSCFDIRPDAEITIECNPASTLRYKFAAYRAAGINRLSIGLQSADNGELRCLGRIHLFEDFLKCYQYARLEDFHNINIDLMNDIPGQTAQSWKKTLRTVLMLRPEHLSIYNLIVEDGTPFGAMQKAGTLRLPDEDTQAAIDQVTKELTEKAGMERYEISNYAHPGFACRHNLGYWSNVPYLGFGLGASSYLQETRWSVTRDYETYMETDLSDPQYAPVLPGLSHGLPAEDKAGAKEGNAAAPAFYENIEHLTREAQMEEFMFLGLRRTAGISEIEFKTRFQVSLHGVFGTQLDQFVRQGLMTYENYHYRFTERGMDVSNLLLCQFLLS